MIVRAVKWVVLLLTLAAGLDEPYCSVRYKRLCKDKGQHVACQFSEPGPGASCDNYTSIVFDNDMKNFMLYYINRRRQRIAAGNEKVRGGMRLPRVEIMMLVEWDRELAHLAQRLADQCHFIHDACRATVRYPYAGQTVGEVRWRGLGASVAGGARRAVRRVLDAWWGERRRVSPQQLTAPFRMTPSKGSVWGHFSQLCVWGLQAMGCGAVRHGTSHPRLLLVCDFSHTNMLGQRTLTAGHPAPCPIHTMRRPRTHFPLLCAPVRREASSIEPEETYDDDGDPGLTVDAMGVGDVSFSSTIVYSRSTWSKAATNAETTLAVTRGASRDELRPKNVMIEKIAEELERNKAVDKNHMVGDQLLQEWRRRTTEELWQQPHIVREPQENFQEVIPLQHHQTTKQTDYRSTVFEVPATQSLPRQHWKQTRDRPLRPGANALQVTAHLATESTKLIPRQSATSMMLDEEDIDQLFKDTGFKASRKRI